MCEREIVLKYFNDISTKYDENNKKLYWKLADDLLWEIIKKYIPRNKSITFLELGAGQTFRDNEYVKSSIRFSTKFKF